MSEISAIARQATAAEADYVVVIDKGAITAKGTPMQLKERFAHDKLRLVYRSRDRVAEMLENLAVQYDEGADCFLVNLESTLDSLVILEKCKPYLEGFEVTCGTMDDAFIAITGKEIRE